MKVLIGYDGSQGAQEMFQDLECAGLPETGSMTIVAVTEMWLPPSTSLGGMETDFTADYRAATDHALAKAKEPLARLEEIFPGWTFQAEGYYGSPAYVLLERAGELKPDLIVLGSRSHIGIERLIFGSVAHRVATAAACSVRIARSHKPLGGRPVHVVIGIDGSLGSADAVDTVAGRNWPEGCEALLVTSAGPFDLIGTAPAQKHELAQQLHQEAHRKLAERGIFVTSIIEEQDPKHALLEIAEKREADCVYLGTRNLKVVDRWLMGSVSTAVVGRAKCSVEIVRHRE